MWLTRNSNFSACFHFLTVLTIVQFFFTPLQATATHFRYGTINYEMLGRRQVLFTLRAAFRRNYNWGAFFKEQYSADGTNWFSSTSCNSADIYDGSRSCLVCRGVVSSTGDNVNEGSCNGVTTGAASQTFSDTTNTFSGYFLRFPVGMGAAGYHLVPHLNVSDAGCSVEENCGGVQCQSPFNKGFQSADAVNYDGTDPDWLFPFGEVPSPFAISRSSVDGVNLTINGESREVQCTPWSEAFGFFFGDGTQQDDGVIMSITEVNHGDSLTENVLLAETRPPCSTGLSPCLDESPLVHTYSADNLNGEPFIAYFTGGNRITFLNNNAEGRYRLEVQVSIVCSGNDASTCNRSPIATQIPVLPVPYTAAPAHARFQIASFDPDNTDNTYRLGNSREHGGLQMNKIGNNIRAWYPDVYNANICSEGLGFPSFCANFPDSDIANTYISLCVSDPDNIPSDDNCSTTLNSGNCCTRNQFTDSENLPSPPPYLWITAESGFVTWETGESPFGAFYDGIYHEEEANREFIQIYENHMEGTPFPQFPNGTLITQLLQHPPVPVGFYNLVVMVEDSVAGVTVPLDFLLYLYPPMHYCSSSCNNTADPSSFLATFVNADDGLYGLPAVGGGTGTCRLCGGGGMVDPSLTNAQINEIGKVPLYATDGLMNNTFCSVDPTLTGNATDDCGGDFSCTPGLTDLTGFLEYGQGDCLGYGTSVSNVIPYSGERDVCMLNSAPFFLTNGFPDGCATDPTTDCIVEPTSISGPTPSMGPLVTSGVMRGTRTPAQLIADLRATVTFTLRAYDPDDCVELTIGTTGLLSGMSLSPEIIVDSRTRERTFSWPGSVTNRPSRTVICFFAFDNYLVSNDPLHCVEILLVDTSLIQWCNTLEPNGSPSVYPDGTIFDAYIGESTCIPLCVSKDAFSNTGVSVEIETIKEKGTTLTIPFAFPYDDINFPNDRNFNNGSIATGLLPATAFPNPYKRNFCFTPTVEEECAYTVCFQGRDNTPGENFNSTTTDRCYRIQVKNRVATFDGNQIAEVQNISAVMKPDLGLTMSAWVFPNCSKVGESQTLMYFGSSRSGMMDTRASIKFMQEKLGYSGFFSYFDIHTGEHRSENIFVCGLWHYVAVTINGQSGNGILVVDNVEASFALNTGTKMLKFSRTNFNTPSRPDNGADGTAYGVFTIGADAYGQYGFDGYIDEIGVWNRELTLKEVQMAMRSREVPTELLSELKGYYRMDYFTSGADLEQYFADSSPGISLPMNFTSSTNINIPPMVPCVLGVEQPVGPCDGSCAMEVYGWGFAKSVNPKCRFGHHEVPATYVSDTVVECSSPGHYSPRVVDLTASNDGYSFTDFYWSQKEITHTYMESSLFVNGINGAGASADSVCQDLPTRAVTFGGWFCPRCGPLINPPPPPSPPPPMPPSPPPPSPPPFPPPSPTKEFSGGGK